MTMWSILNRTHCRTPKLAAAAMRPPRSVTPGGPGVSHFTGTGCHPPAHRGQSTSGKMPHGSHPSLLKVCWPFERRPHVEQPAVAYRVKGAEVVHAFTALIRPHEHIVVDR